MTNPPVQALEAKAENNQGELTEDQIRDTAKLVTLRVFSVDRKDWENSGLGTIYISGSGVLINRNTGPKNQSFTYILLTNNHVLKSPNNQFYIQTPDGLIHQGFLHPKNSKFGKNDLGMLWFYSPYFYHTAIPSKSSNLVDKKNLTFVAGFPCELTTSPTMECPGTFTFTRGYGRKIDKPLKDGYQIAFTNKTREGMSGGPVFNTQGNFIGINGRGENDPSSEQYKYIDGSSTPKAIKGQSPALALPIETYLNLFPNNEQIFGGINPPKSFNIYTLNIKNSNQKNNVNNQSSQNKSELVTNGLTLEIILLGIILIVVIVIMLILTAFWIKYYDFINNLKNNPHNRKPAPVDIAILTIKDGELLLLDGEKKHKTDLSKSTFTFIETREDVIIILKRPSPSLNTRINPIVTHPLDMSYKLNEINSEENLREIKKEISERYLTNQGLKEESDKNLSDQTNSSETTDLSDNYEAAWVLTRNNNKHKYVFIEVHVPSQSN